MIYYSLSIKFNFLLSFSSFHTYIPSSHLFKMDIGGVFLQMRIHAKPYWIGPRVKSPHNL